MEHGLNICEWPVDELYCLEYINEKLFVSQFFGPKEILNVPDDQAESGGYIW